MADQGVEHARNEGVACADGAVRVVRFRFQEGKKVKKRETERERKRGGPIWLSSCNVLDNFCARTQFVCRTVRVGLAGQFEGRGASFAPGTAEEGTVVVY